MKHLLIAFTIIVLSISCRTEQKETKKVPVIKKEDVLEMNRILIEKDDELIMSYIKRRGWDMKKTGTGLWYMINEKGNGKKAEPGDAVKINYKLELLDGTPCYSSDSLGAKVFIVGKGNVEQGLEEGIRMLREGDEARFIMPPHLAHHLLGDENKIPSRATIVYFVELLKISNN